MDDDEKVVWKSWASEPPSNQQLQRRWERHREINLFCGLAEKKRTEKNTIDSLPKQ